METKFKNHLSYLALSFTSLILTSTNSLAGPISSPYSVNTYTTGEQQRPSIAMGGSGDHVIIYRDKQRNSAFSRQYNANGSSVYTTEQPTGVSSVISTSMDGNGNYVIVKSDNDGSDNGVYATVFDKYGTVIVNRFRVNSIVTGNQSAADVAMNRNGDFVVSWTDLSTSTAGAYVKKFNLGGTALTGDLQVNSSSSSADYEPAIAVSIDESGAFAVNYLSVYYGSSNLSDVWARKYDSFGTPISNPFRVNTTIPGTQAGSDIAMDAYGNFIVSWESYNNGVQGIYGQRYNINAQKVGGEFLVNDLSTDTQGTASVAMSSDGSSVFLWTQWNQNVSGVTNIFAKEFDPSGIARSNQFQVNTATTLNNFWPEVAMDACGYYVITWEAKDANDNKDIYARRYASPTPSAAPCLANGKTVSNLNGTAGSWKYFKITVPAGKSLIDIQQSGPAFGDADLYVRYGALPTLTQYHFAPYLNGNDERVTYQSPPAGDWYIGVYGYDNFSSVNLNAQYY